MAKISVIVPVYNTAAFLKRCVQSVLEQTFDDWELILVNDGSPDNAWELMLPYAANPKIRLLSSPNRGLSAARNAGVEVARGQWIYFLDSDDFIHPQLLEIAYRALCTHRTDFAYFCLRHIQPGEEPDTLATRFERVPERVVLAPFSDFLNPSADIEAVRFLWPRALFNRVRFTPRLKFEDICFVRSVLPLLASGVFLDYAPYYYVQRPGSLSLSPPPPSDLFHLLWILDTLSEAYRALPLWRENLYHRLGPLLIVHFWKRIDAQADALSPDLLKLNRRLLATIILRLIKQGHLALDVLPLRWKFRFLQSALSATLRRTRLADFLPLTNGNPLFHIYRHPITRRP